MMNASDIALDCRHLSARYGRITVCRDISFQVNKGELVTVMGPNGAGKTSLIGYIAGAVAGSGEVVIDGSSISNLPCYKRAQMGLRLVPEGRGLFPPMTVRQNLELGGRLAPPDRRAFLMKRATELFPILQKRMDQTASDMSGGEQQMLAVAKAIAGDPKVLILDEPTQGLAPQVFGILRDALLALKQDGMSIVLVEQRHAFAESVADRRLVLVGGRIAYQGKHHQPLGREELMAIYTRAEAA
jgi:branched-chain amino acid transport system ATP-binding protein